MVFNSISFLVFLLIISLLYFAANRVWIKKWTLIAGSLLFVGTFNWISLIAVLVICLGNYYLLRSLSSSRQASSQRKFYLSGVLFNACILILYNFIQDVFTGGQFLKVEGFNNSKWIILGIGFYTLQVIGYYFEVYKKLNSFSISFPDFFLSLALFSKLPSGPILNLNEAKCMFEKRLLHFEEGNVAYGIHRILLGLFKKLALADRLVPYVNSVFDTHSYFNGLMIYAGPFLFTIQLYLDFSAYLDMAVGSARIFGIKLPENFNMPLRATSIIEFWRRWHITLVNWLTNYVFYPVSYNFRRVKLRGVAIAVIVTFLVSALWHGFALTFLIWAACHFSYIIFENLIRRKSIRSTSSNLGKKVFQIAIVWHLVAFSNIFFRSHSLTDAIRLFSDFMDLPFLYSGNLDFKTWLINGGQDIETEFNFRLSVLLCLLFLLFEKRINQFAVSEKYNIAYVAFLLVMIAVFGMFNTGERFIYLQF